MPLSGFPRRFGSYVLLKPLARGGMGELDLAATGGHGMEKMCVIKRVLPHLLDTDNVERFREEATVVVRLSHGNLVGVFDAGREEGQFYLAMDFVEGKDLLATWNQCAMKRVAFPIEIAAYVIKELTRGLAYAHSFRELHLVHRDISPANVMLSYSGEVKLTDFGLATSKLKEQRTAPGIIYGKLAYLAPEQARGLPLDGRTDLYAAGILLWEMLTGQQLFPHKASASVSPSPGNNPTLDALERLKNPVIAPPSSLTSRVPAALDTIVLRALAVEPADRYQTGEDMRAELASFLALHAPETDAATLAAFMKVLFLEQIGQERSDRDQLMAEAATLLSGNLNVEGLDANDGDPAVRQPSAPSRQRRRTGKRPAEAAPEPDPEATTGAIPRATDQTPGLGSKGGRRIRERRGLVGGEFSARPDGPEVGGAHEAAVVAVDAAEGDPNNPDQDQRVGSTIAGRYYLRRLCGEGAMGKVYEGHHVEIGRRVAVKILHSNFRNTPEVVERFRREARAASKIGHPNIVDVTDAGTTPDGAFFFVMEYLDGVDVEQVIVRDGPLAVERALRIAAQVCRALVAAHEAGIIHRDLKPANVMLVRHRDEEDFVKVLDFGISKQSELDIDPRGKAVGLTRPDVAVGTPIYMAPEQVAGHAADGRTDVYAVGELLFEMLTGTPPCSGSDVIAVFNKKANEDPPPVRSLRPEISGEVERMLTQAMSRHPAHRHPTMAIFKDEIMRCLAHAEQTPAAPASPLITETAIETGTETETEADASLTKRVWRPPSSAVWIAGAGLVVGLGLAAMGVLWRTDGSPSPGKPRAASERARPLARDRAVAPGAPSRMPAPTPVAAAESAAATAAVRAASMTPAAETTRDARLSPSSHDSEGVAVTKASAGVLNPAVAGRGRAPGTTPAGTSHRPARIANDFQPRSPASGASKSAPPIEQRLGDPNRARPAASGTTAAGLQQAALAVGSGADAVIRGRAAFAKGDFPQAVRLARSAVASGEAVGGHLLLGDSFYKMERFADALSEYNVTLTLAPGHPQARRGQDLAAQRAKQR